MLLLPVNVNVSDMFDTEFKQHRVNFLIDCQPFVEIAGTVDHNCFDRNVDEVCDYTRFVSHYFLNIALILSAVEDC